MSTSVYKWKDGAHIRINAKVAGAELERIRTKHRGRLTPKDVLDEAKSNVSPLHKHFTWDDTKAAQQYRLQQAGELIRSIEVVVEQAKPAGRASGNVRAFVSVKEGKKRAYTSIADAMSDTDLRAQVLADALRELQTWRKRYEQLSEFSKVFAAIDRSVGKIADKAFVSLKKAA